MSQAINITTPVGRVVMGSLYTPGTTDAEGKPLVVKTGPNAGQPRVNYFFALAIPKLPGHTHWAQTEWGAKIWALGHQAFPQAAQSQDFAWKIVDGDSQQPGKMFKGKPGKKPCENEGWPGNWIVKFSGGFAPKVYVQEGSGYVQNVQPDFCKPGYFVEVNCEIEGNGSQTQPGIYVNHRMICFRAYGQEITFGPDVASAGFGASPLPAGASMTPMPGAIPMPGQAPAAAPAAYAPPVPGMAPYAPPMPGMAPYAPPMPGMAPNVAYAPPPVPGVPAGPSPFAGTATPPSVPASAPMGYASPATTSPSSPAIPVVPNPQFLQVPAPVARQMTAQAGGVPYEAFIAKGWTDAMLVQNGMMLA